jgi:hypothetical protein
VRRRYVEALRIADGAAEHAIVIQEQELAAAAWKPLDDMVGVDGGQYRKPGTLIVRAKDDVEL